VIAACAVAVDRFYGFSSAWIRFVSIGLQLRSALRDFHLDWQSRLATCGGTLRAEDVAPVLATCRAFVATIDGLVQSETAEWAAEFSTALREVEKNARNQTGPHQANLRQEM
jgi:hypothetical protein